MSETIASLVPVFLLIALGYALRHTVFTAQAMWAGIDRLNYYVFFPALILNALAGGDLSPALVGEMGLAILATLGAAAAILIALKLVLPVDGPAFTSLVQGMLRWNAFVALPIIEALYGARGLAVAGVVFLVLVPAVNVMSVYALSRLAGTGPVKGASLARSILSNPLILACLAGLMLSWSPLALPGPAAETITLIGRAAVPLGLLAVGAALSFTVFRAAPRLIALALALKLATMPALAALAVRLLGADAVAGAVIVIAMATPTATSAYTLSRMMGGDAPLMASIISATTLGAIVSLPVVLALLR